jgi:hypothetical protein
VYLDQESPRGRRKHKSKSSSPTGEKSKAKKEKIFKEAAEAVRHPPKSVRKMSDDKVKRTKSNATSEMKRSKSIAATERTAHTQIAITVTDTGAAAAAGAELDRHGTHKSSKREKSTWHGYVSRPIVESPAKCSFTLGILLGKRPPALTASQC